MLRRALYPGFGIVFCILALTAGCKTPELLRLQADDDNEKDRYAVIRAGAHKGDVYDVEVSLPPGSGVKSLRGGYLKEVVLRDFDTARNLNPDTKGGDRALAGNPCAKAEGPVQAGWGAGEDEVSL